MNYLNQINNKKDILFSNVNLNKKNQTENTTNNQINIYKFIILNKKKILVKKNNSFKNKSKTKKDLSNPIKSAHIKSTNKIQKNNNSNNNNNNNKNQFKKVNFKNAIAILPMFF